MRKNYRSKGYRYSYDMLGEAARTQQMLKNILNPIDKPFKPLVQAADDKGPIEGPVFQLNYLHYIRVMNLQNTNVLCQN